MNNALRLLKQTKQTFFGTVMGAVLSVSPWALSDPATASAPAGSSVGSGAGANNAFPKPEKAVKYRQAVMTTIAHHFGQLGAVVNGKAPFDAEQVRQNAHVLATLARLPWPAFTENTKNLATHTKPEVWTKPQEFKKLADELVQKTRALEAVAQGHTGNNASADLSRLKMAFEDAAKTCKACHKAYEKE
jgi:cytochrome c556